MIRNYLKVAFRNLFKNKLYSIVNIVGLSMGITCCILIGLYIFHEFSYDRFNQKADRIVRVNSEYSVEKAIVKTSGTPTMPGPLCARNFPEVEYFVRLVSYPRIVRYADKIFDERDFMFADSSFFKIFSFPLIEGNPNEVLNAPHKIVLTERMERKYFGNVAATGKILRVVDQDYIVSGVVKDPPANSHIQFDCLASYITLNEALEWNHFNHFTYLLLRRSSDISSLQEKITEYMKDPSVNPTINMGDYLTFQLQPLTRVHLYSSQVGISSTVGAMDPYGNIVYIYILGIIALLILCIASVNYTNLAIAQSEKRNAEIGIRKVLGASFRQLFTQFIGESLLFAGIALVVATVIAFNLLPIFNQVTGKHIEAGLLANPVSLLVIAGFGLFTGFMAGLYPALILSNFNLIRLLKSGFSFSRRFGVFRKSLTVFQFMAAVFLIVSTIVILQQLSYIQHKELGFDKDHVIVLPIDRRVHPGFEEFKAAIKLLPNVKNVGAAFESPTNIHWDDIIYGNNGKQVSVHAMPVDPDIIQTLSLQLVAGTDFTLSDYKRVMDSAAIASGDVPPAFMLNEAAVKALGWKPEDAVGKVIRRGSPGMVKAVVKDFHFASLHDPIKPLVIFLEPGYNRLYTLFVKVNGDNLPNTISQLEKFWKDRVPYRPFEYHFFDDEFGSIYLSEQHTAKIFSIFSFLAIVLACLGLFGLTAYSIAQRSKEIGIRKVLGASVGQVVGLVSKDFMKLVVVGIVLATPLAWLATYSWLQNFAYRVNIYWWIFLVAAITCILVALITISIQAIKAALANPIKSLRSE